MSIFPGNIPTPLLMCSNVPDMTVHEQLVPFRGRCAFRQYIPSKPVKYRLKISWNCNVDTSYLLKGDVYLGRHPVEARQVGLEASVV